jgi:hypothetical protein
MLFGICFCRSRINWVSAAPGSFLGVAGSILEIPKSLRRVAKRGLRLPK